MLNFVLKTLEFKVFKEQGNNIRYQQFVSPSTLVQKPYFRVFKLCTFYFLVITSVVLMFSIDLLSKLGAQFPKLSQKEHTIRITPTYTFHCSINTYNTNTKFQEILV